MKANFRLERQLFKKGFKTVAGIDEVGRGALFGPVVAAAVIWPAWLVLKPALRWMKDINDSKSLGAAKRKKLAKCILSEAEAVGVGFASNEEIDQKNIYWASLEAMTRAVQSLHLTPDVLFIDGSRLKLRALDIAQQSIPHGDRKSRSIAAASIVAKVLRDEMMVTLDHVFKGYGLCRNKGYGTRDHYQALRELGPTCCHRLTFNLKA